MLIKFFLSWAQCASTDQKTVFVYPFCRIIQVHTFLFRLDTNIGNDCVFDTHIKTHLVVILSGLSYPMK